MNRYLSGSSQAVYLDGAMSSFLSVEVGVPQGSILGPLCYILFTNDLPESILDTSSHVHFSDLTTHCAECGGLCCFADDSTYSVTGKNIETLEKKLNDKYKALANYMNSNRLKLNDDKTHLLIMTTGQKQKLLNIQVKIRTSAEDIKPIRTEKLLGVNVQNYLKWSEYIQNNERSFIRQLNTRVNALKQISSAATFKTRLMVANGIFCSKLIFQISLWGGAADYLLSSLQIIQNKAARQVTKRDKYSPIVEILRQCGWLSVRQLVFYHSIIQIYKTKQTSYPKYISDKLNLEFPYNTRLAGSESVRMGTVFKSRLALTERSFLNRSTVNFNQLPTELRQIQKIELFKRKLKQWVILNIRI